MKLKNKIYFKLIPMFILNVTRRIEKSEFMAFMDIAEYILFNKDIGNLNDKYMIEVKVSYLKEEDMILITFKHVDYSDRISLVVGNYGRDDYWYYDLLEAINKIFGSKHNNWDIVDVKFS